MLSWQSTPPVGGSSFWTLEDTKIKQTKKQYTNTKLAGHSPYWTLEGNGGWQCPTITLKNWPPTTSTLPPASVTDNQCIFSLGPNCIFSLGPNGDIFTRPKCHRQLVFASFQNYLL